MNPWRRTLDDASIWLKGLPQKREDKRQKSEGSLGEPEGQPFIYFRAAKSGRELLRGLARQSPFWPGSSGICLSRPAVRQTSEAHIPQFNRDATPVGH